MAWNGYIRVRYRPVWAVLTFHGWANFFKKLSATFKFWTPEFWHEKRSILRTNNSTVACKPHWHLVLYTWYMWADTHFCMWGGENLNNAEFLFLFWCMYRAACAVYYPYQQIHNMCSNNTLCIVSTPTCFDSSASSSGCFILLLCSSYKNL